MTVIMVLFVNYRFNMFNTIIKTIKYINTNIYYKHYYTFTDL